MKVRLTCLLLAFVVGLSWPSKPASHAAGSLALFGTFHAMGVVVTVDAGDDADLDATAGVEYRVSGSGTFRGGLPLSHVSDTRFAGSLFWLEPGTAYEVRVTFADPDGGPLDGKEMEGTASTRAKVKVPKPTLASALYVSPGGSGTVCSYDLPCSLAEGLGQAQPGAHVFLRGGVYYQGEIDLPRSGRAGAATSSAATPFTTISTVLGPVPTMPARAPAKPTCTRTWCIAQATTAWRPMAHAATCASGATLFTTC